MPPLPPAAEAAACAAQKQPPAESCLPPCPQGFVLQAIPVDAVVLNPVNPIDRYIGKHSLRPKKTKKRSKRLTANSSFSPKSYNGTKKRTKNDPLEKLVILGRLAEPEPKIGVPKMALIPLSSLRRTDAALSRQQSQRKAAQKLRVETRRLETYSILVAAGVRCCAINAAQGIKKSCKALSLPF